MPNLTRAINILLRPNQEWQAVSRETSSIGSLYLHYITPLAALGPIAAFLGMTVIGVGPFRVPWQYGLSTAVMSFVMGLLGVFLIALVIDGLAVPFRGRRDRRQALKLVAYSLTPFWLSGVLLLIPALGIVSLLAGAYAIYLLYLGLPVLMATPRDQVAYTACVIVLAVLMHVALGAVSGVILDLGGVQPLAAVQAEPQWKGLSASEQESLEKLKAATERMQSVQDVPTTGDLLATDEPNVETPEADQ